MNTIKAVAVLLTCHNRKEKTVSCLKSLFQATLPKGFSFSVFLVDDGSTDGTAKAVKENYPKVNIIQGDGKLFWNRGMHLAWETAAKVKEYDFYLWLNDDVVLMKKSLKLLIEATCNNEDAIVCGSMCSKYKSQITYGARGLNDKLITPNGKVQECKVFNGNCVLIPSSVYSKLGNLDARYPHAIGDFDYALRAIKHGLKIYIASEFVGYCEKNKFLPKWCLPEISIRQRIKSLYSPLGSSHPYYFFLFELQHYGLLVAFKHFFSIHLRLLIPSLWKK